MAVKEECCYIGRGEIFLRKCLTQAEVDAGVVSEYISVGNTEQFSVTSEVNTITKKNYISKCGGIECAYSSIDDIQLNLTLCCYKDLNVGLALAAGCIEVDAIDAAPAAPDTQDYTLAADGEAVVLTLLPNPDVSTFVFTINGIASTDYTYDPVTGTVTYTGPALFLGDVVSLDYSTLEIVASPASKKFNLFSCNTDVYELQFRGCNAAKGNDGKDYILDLYQVCFEPASEFQFITEEFGTIELTGRLLPDRTKAITGVQDGTAGTFPSEYGAWCLVEAAA